MAAIYFYILYLRYTEKSIPSKKKTPKLRAYRIYRKIRGLGISRIPVDRGIAEKADEIRWLFPNLSADEIDEKLARIEANKSVNEDEVLERMLMGEI